MTKKTECFAIFHAFKAEIEAAIGAAIAYANTLARIHNVTDIEHDY